MNANENQNAEDIEELIQYKEEMKQKHLQIIADLCKEFCKVKGDAFDQVLSVFDTLHHINRYQEQYISEYRNLKSEEGYVNSSVYNKICSTALQNTIERIKEDTNLGLFR